MTIDCITSRGSHKLLLLSLIFITSTFLLSPISSIDTHDTNIGPHCSWTQNQRYPPLTNSCRTRVDRTEWHQTPPNCKIRTNRCRKQAGISPNSANGKTEKREADRTNLHRIYQIRTGNREAAEAPLRSDRTRQEEGEPVTFGEEAATDQGGDTEGKDSTLQDQHQLSKSQATLQTPSITSRTPLPDTLRREKTTPGLTELWANKLHRNSDGRGPHQNRKEERLMRGRCETPTLLPDTLRQEKTTPGFAELWANKLHRSSDGRRPHLNRKEKKLLRERCEDPRSKEGNEARSGHGKATLRQTEVIRANSRVGGSTEAGNQEQDAEVTNTEAENQREQHKHRGRVRGRRRRRKPTIQEKQH